jgi:hypothetical protein
MDSINEALIINFYSHKLHVEDACNLQYPSDGMVKLCEDIFSCLLAVECKEIIRIIQKIGLIFDISHGDVPQFSNLEDCVYKVPLLIKDCGIDEPSYTQLGFMLRTKPRKEGADMKYGENQSKTAAQMGLCSISNARIHPSYLGIAFCNLDKESQMKLLPKLILFIPFIFNQFATNAKYEDIIASVSFLSQSTQKRRLTNIWSLINHVNKVLPYEFQIIRY